MMCNKLSGVHLDLRVHLDFRVHLGDRSALGSWEWTCVLRVHVDLDHLSAPGSWVMTVYLAHGSELGALECTWIMGVHSSFCLCPALGCMCD